MKYKNGYYIYELKNSKTFEPHVLIFKLTDKIDIRRGKKSAPLSNLSIYYTCKNINKNIIIIINNKFNSHMHKILLQLCFMKWVPRVLQ